MIATKPASRIKAAAGRKGVRVTKTVRKPAVRKTTARPTTAKTAPRKTAAKPAVKKTVVKKVAARKAVAKKTTKPKALPLETRFEKATAFDAAPTKRYSPKAGELVADPTDEVAAARIAEANRRPAKRRARNAIANHKRSAVERLDDPPPAPVGVMLGRVSIAIERELTQIERIVGGTRVKSELRTEAERRARTLASLARTLREVMQLRSGEEKKQDDDAVPRDINEFRRRLARRLEQLAAEAKAAHPGEADGG
ncbi:hypothetical protein ASC80_21310 [Afipia sp. Root123D2]|uniref:hypothetical protein n=1 Tax=Afipia sp. Root123D2 TaxID=1736436 RepID=UPI0006F9A27F|nr:hypothetical protein [Afipia sp. Root123D2]KQW18546.1 hypothetical protein ASC80_21310 [Afipia sp. Root123D2]